ncbi:heterocyst frequency control protein PatD [Cylindrospermopsis raciborskii]|nr:heterocyst frequency control protein PatD [Cylindrospermopsis raciborskii]
MAEPSNPILEYIIVLQIEEIEVLMSFKYQKYQELKTLVELLLSDVNKAHVYDPTWKSLLGQISGFFAREIAVFTDLGSRQQSYQTEISKQIRLLEVDMIFLQGAKQTLTIKSRLESIQQRAETLTRYCQTILEISC